MRSFRIAFFVYIRLIRSLYSYRIIIGKRTQHPAICYMTEAIANDCENNNTI